MVFSNATRPEPSSVSLPLSVSPSRQPARAGDLAFPVIALAVVGLIVMGVIAFVALRQHDAAQARHEEALVRTGIADAEQALGRVAKDFSWYDIAIEKLLNRFDPVFAANTMGRYLADQHGVDATFVLDKANRTVFVAIDGNTDQGEATARFSNGLERLVDQARAASPDEPNPALGLLRLDGAVHIVAASALTPQYNFGRLAAQDRGVLILTRRLDAVLLAELGAGYLTSTPQVFGPGEHVGQADASIALVAADGSALGALAWSATRPSRTLLAELLAPMAGAALVGLACLWVFVRRAQAVTRRIEDDARLVAAQNEALDASERRTRSIVEAAADGIATVGIDGAVLSINPAGAALFGARSEDAIGRPLSDFLGESGKAASLDALAREGTTEAARRRHVLGRRTGGSFFVSEIAVTRTLDNGASMFIVLARDVTEHRRAEASLDVLATGLIMIAENGRVLLCNRSADRLIGRGDALKMEDGVLHACAPWYDEELQGLVGKALKATGSFPEGTGVMNLYPAPGAKPLHLIVTPVRLTEDADSAPAAAIIVRDPHAQTEVRPEFLRQLYGLTKAEARVVAELAKGKRLQEVAEDLNVSLNTVRNQLKQAFSKTSTNRQADLVSLVLTSVADLAQDSPFAAPQPENRPGEASA